MGDDEIRDPVHPGLRQLGLDALAIGVTFAVGGLICGHVS